MQKECKCFLHEFDLLRLEIRNLKTKKKIHQNTLSLLEILNLNFHQLTIRTITIKHVESSTRLWVMIRNTLIAAFQVCVFGVIHLKYS